MRRGFEEHGKFGVSGFCGIGRLGGVLPKDILLYK